MLTDDVCTVLNGPNKISSDSEGVVDNQGDAVVMGNLRLSNRVKRQPGADIRNE